MRYLERIAIRMAIDENVLHTYPIFAIYAKANVHNDDHDVVIVPKHIAERAWCLTDIDPERFVVKVDGKFKIVKEPDGEIVYGLRRPRDGDTVIVVRHPVKAKHCVLSARLKIVDRDENIVRVSNSLIETIEGDFDGDQLLLMFFDPEIIEPIGDIEKVEDEEEFELESFDEFEKKASVNLNIEIDPKLLSKILKFESDVNFIDFVLKYIAEDPVDLEVLKALRSNNALGKALREIEKVDTVVTEIVRMYFRSQGPKYAGYVQKVLIDIADVLLEMKDSLGLDEDFVKFLEDAEYLVLVDRLQQKVIDLKHIENDIALIDDAKELQKLVMRKPSFEETLAVVKKFVDDPKKAEYCAFMLCLAANRKDLLVWSYGLVKKFVTGWEIETEIARDIRRVFE